MSTLHNEPQKSEVNLPEPPPLPPKRGKAFADLMQRLSSGPWVFHRPRGRKIPRPAHCLNCGDSLTGNFCANCGQEAVDERAAIWPLVSDVLSEFARWDSKFVRTLLPLLFRPGYLTNEYNSGKRASYLAPFRLFLSVSVLFFLLLSWRGGSLLDVHTNSVTTGIHSVNSNLSKLSQQQQKVQAQLSDKDDVDDINDSIHDNVGDINDSIHDARDLLPPTAQKQLKGVHVTAQELSEGAASRPPVHISGSDLASLVLAWNRLPRIGAATQQELDWASSRDNWNKVPLLFAGYKIHGSLRHLPTTVELYDALQANPSYPHKDPRFWRRVVERLYKYGSNHQEFSDNLYNLAPKVAIGLIPIFALLMYPLYLRTRRYYVEHLVFALHNHTFLFIAAAIGMYTQGIMGSLLFVATIVYMFVAMKVVYQQHWLKTLLKFWFVGSNYTVLLIVAVILTVAATLFYG